MKSNIKNTVKVGDILTVKPEKQIWVSKVDENDNWVPKNVKWELAEVVKVYKTADEVNNDKEYCENITHEDGDHFPLFRIEDPRRGELELYSHSFFVDIIKKAGRKDNTEKRASKLPDSIWDKVN